MKKILMLLILFLTISCIEKKEGIITAKYAATQYYINSYKNSNLYLTESQYKSLLETNVNNNRLIKENVKFFVLNGDINEKVYVDDYEFNKYKEGDFYKEQ